MGAAMSKPGTLGLAGTIQATSQEIDRLRAALRQIIEEPHNAIRIAQKVLYNGRDGRND
jgi:hypothetical protein